MKLYIHWIYSSNIDLNVLDWSAVADHTVQLYADQTTLLFRLYIAVDMFLDTVLKNRVTDSLIDRATSGLWNHDVRSLVYVWEHTLPEASLRRLIVDHIMNHKNLDWVRDHGTKVGESFLYCITVGLIKERDERVGMQEKRVLQKVLYHD
ncbi:hypothetical protein LTR56_028177 [Elasticomyces elasticus]|nr:hypothetical protein LTR56_028177 [Elasticomyces elasticus]